MQRKDLKSVLTGVQPGGCVQPHLEGFANELLSEGYVPSSILAFVRSATHLGCWMDSQGIGIKQLSEAVISKFGRHKCKCPLSHTRGRRPTLDYVKRVRRFVMYLVQESVVLPLSRSTQKSLPSELQGFRDWMVQHRGIKPQTIERYQRIIEKMLPGLGPNPSKYEATHIRQVLFDEIDAMSPAYAKTYTTALRVFLRFLAARGKCKCCLDHAVPTIPQWRLSACPRYLEPGDVERMLASCDLQHPMGIRDRAILLLLVQLGLRAGDILALRLSALDFKAGTIRVIGKGRKEVCLPLPQVAGDALIGYLEKARPTANIDHVFLCMNAPARPLTNSSTVSSIVRLALKRAGIANAPTKGAHLLRHTAATTMLRSGASLDAIATVLRHQSTDTTAYYAKVDVEMLSTITQPWPEVDHAS